MGTAERPQQGQRLVKRQAAIRRPVPPQRGELLDQLPYCQARYRLRHLEAETAQQASDGRRPAAEVVGGERFLTWKEAVRGTHDRLRIVGLAVNHQTAERAAPNPYFSRNRTWPSRSYSATAWRISRRDSSGSATRTW